jgi:HSP20 family protein
MDMEKLKQWMEVTKTMHGGDFWNNIFEQDFAKQFMNEEHSKMDGQPSRNEKNPSLFPVFEILEGNQEVVVMIELPGVLKDNIKLDLAGNTLTIKGTVLPIHPHLNRSYTERYYGEFQRKIPLPDTVSSKQLSAKFWQGILFVSYLRTYEKGEIIPIDE